MAQEGNDLIEMRDWDRGPGSEDQLASGSDTSLSMDVSADDRDVSSSGTDETSQIMEQIEETRNNMGETIDAIQDRLSFSNLSEQVSEHVTNAVDTAKDAVYEATIGKAAEVMKEITSKVSSSSVIRTAKSNPLPLVLIGLGAGLLAYQSYSGKKSGAKRGQLSYRSKGSGSLPIADSASSSPTADVAGKKLSGITDSVSATASNAYNKVTGAVDTAYSQTYEKVGELGNAAREQYDHYLDESPLAVGAVALALGAAVGFAIPSTRYEDELLGETRARLVDQAGDKAIEFLDNSKAAIKDSVGEQAGSIMQH